MEVAGFILCPVYPWRKSPWSPQDMILDGPQNQNGCDKYGKDILPVYNMTAYRGVEV